MFMYKGNNRRPCKARIDGASDLVYTERVPAAGTYRFDVTATEARKVLEPILRHCHPPSRVDHLPIRIYRPVPYPVHGELFVGILPGCVSV